MELFILRRLKYYLVVGGEFSRLLGWRIVGPTNYHFAIISILRCRLGVNCNLELVGPTLVSTFHRPLGPMLIKPYNHKPKNVRNFPSAACKFETIGKDCST